LKSRPEKHEKTGHELSMNKTSELSEGKLMATETAIEINIRSLPIKRSFDIILSSFGILLSLPLWLLIALAIKLDDGGPVFYSHYRVGKDGKLFKAYKFRSMIKDAEKKKGAVWAEENDSRVTSVGRILRATAFDEFPQLINIFLGDMSFVGPRPERPELVGKFRLEITNFDLRHKVKPGLTGIAQVFGKYDTPPKHKLKYDLLYIKNQNFFLDLKLILLSFWITARGKWQSREKWYIRHVQKYRKADYDMRKFPRYQIITPLRYRRINYKGPLEEPLKYTFTKNIGEGGVLFECSSPINVDTEMELYLKSTTLDKEQKIIGKVVRFQQINNPDYNGKKYDIGVCFFNKAEEENGNQGRKRDINC